MEQVFQEPVAGRRIAEGVDAAPHRLHASPCDASVELSLRPGTHRPQRKESQPAAIHAHPGVDSPIQGGGLPEPAASDLSCAVVVQVRRSGRYRGEEKTAGALGRFYGFGERLRWPKAPVGQDAEYYKHFMVVQPTDGNPAEPWFITNAHSLAGQVFRVGPVADSVQVTALNVTEFKVQGNSIIAGGAANPYQKHFLIRIRCSACNDRIPLDLEFRDI